MAAISAGTEWGPLTTDTASFRPIIWIGSSVKLIDQTCLPGEEVWLEFTRYQDVIESIVAMRIRGAPAIGLAGAYAVALAANEFAGLPADRFWGALDTAASEIGRARPTAVNLMWAVTRVLAVTPRTTPPIGAAAAFVAEAVKMHDEDEAANRRIGYFGAQLLEPGHAALTHCNAGALATGGYGTALGVIRAAWADGKLTRVFATETRPFLQGARLTAWELVRDGIDVSLLPDSAAAQLLAAKTVQAVVVGADRIAANGDVANKIGTYSLAVLAKEHGVPFYVAAPISTIDLATASGDGIPIEMRPDREVTHVGDVRMTPVGITILNPAFDVTPARYVSAIITENGIAREPYGESLRRIVGWDDS